jgi:hypothetical protein
MQETRNIHTNELRREIFSAATHAQLVKAMDADLLPNEIVTKRTELNPDEGKALYIECILRELLAVPDPVFDRPVFTKLNRYLKNYRKFYGWKDPIPADQLPK